MDLLKEIVADAQKNEESLNEAGERTFNTYRAWKSAVLKINEEAEFIGDKEADQAIGLGEWDGKQGVIFGTDEQLTEERATSAMQMISGLKSHPMVDKIVDLHYTADGITALVRTKDGNAYEVEVKQAGMGSGHPQYTKPAQYKERVQKRSEANRAKWFDYLNK